MVSLEVEKKRLLIKLILSNFVIAGENLYCEGKKLFNLLLNCSDGLLWSQTLGTLRTFRWSQLQKMLQLTPIFTG